jgi:arabinogalactan oligomer/maltooligosaccharide transport system substrate-binding protein
VLDLVGRRLGQYEILEEIGRGGMAVVYKAYQPALQRHVAIKVLLPHLSEDQDLVERFEREALAAGRLEHPNIIRIYDVGQDAGLHYLVMSYVAGPSVARRLKEGGALDLHTALSIVGQVGAALDWAHSQGVVHRDVKPSNILLTPQGHAILSDFGIARAGGQATITQQGMLVGTPAYMSPEQARGLRNLDGRTDVYSLGIALYEMLTGDVPFHGDAPTVILRAILDDPPTPPRRLNPAIPPAVERVVLRTLAKERERRYATAGEMVAALQAAATGTPLPERRTVAPGQAKPVVRPRPASAQRPMLLAIAAVAIAMVAMFLALSGQRGPAPSALATTLPSPTWTLKSALKPTAVPPTRVPTAKPTAVPPTAAPTPKPTAIPPTRVPTAKPQQKVTITCWEQEGDTVDVGILDPLVQEFMAANPNITVERTHYGTDELRTQFQTAYLAGNAPDLFRGPNDPIGVFAAMGIVLPVKDMFDQAFLNTFLPGALAGGVLKGVMYGIPDVDGTHLMLLYNKALVRQVPADWNQLIATAQSLTNSDNWGLAINIREPFWLAAFLGAFGGSPLDPVTDHLSLNTSAMVKTLQFMSDLQNKYRIVPPGCDYNTADTLFKEGKAAFLINGDWSLSGYADAGVNFATAAMPPIQSTGLYPTPMTSGKYWVISKQVQKGTAKFDAVKKFVEFMAGEHAQKTWLEKNRQLPSNKNVAKSATIQSDPILQGSMAQLTHGVAMSTAPQLRCFWDSVRPGQEGVLDGSTTPAAAAAKMQEDADRCIKEAGLGAD